MKTSTKLILPAVLCLSLGLAVFAAEKAKDEKATKEVAPINKKCPVEKEDVDPTKFVMYKGKKVAFCCDGCDKDFNKDPEKYMKLLADNGDDNTIKKDKEKAK